MNDNYAVYVSNLSKVYRFYRKPVYRLVEAVRRKPMHTAFSALEDVSFTLSKGATLGIIGENGAGKSTLLKLLARTIKPTNGRIDVNGRVAALLELGAGFHQEFTGRQNIYLNASLMGLSEKEIRDKENAIIEFAGIGDFIDRPIKTYSSGMVVRLGFSIATSVDPDVLIVDEALSVGDQRFQEKCIDRMQNFRKAGKTIIVCSHSIYLVNELCARCIWLDKGRIKSEGLASQVVSEYLAFQESRYARENHNLQTCEKPPDVKIEAIEVGDEAGTVAGRVQQYSRLSVEITTVNTVARSYIGHLVLVMESGEGQALFSTITKDSVPQGILFTGTMTFSLVCPKFVLQKGNIWFRVMVTDENALRIIHRKRKGPFSIISEHPEYGLMWMDHDWIFNLQEQTENE